MDEVPDKIKQAIAKRSFKKSVAVRPTTNTLAPGRIVVVRFGEIRHLFVILDPECEAWWGMCHGTVIHPYIEMATDLDVVLTGEDSPLPYSIVVSSEVYRVIEHNQIERDVLVSLTPEQVRGSQMALATDGESAREVSSIDPLPLGSSRDSRRRFYEDLFLEAWEGKPHL